MTESQRQTLLSQGTRYLILDEKKQRYNKDKDGRSKLPSTPHYLLDLKSMRIEKIDRGIIRK